MDFQKRLLTAANALGQEEVRALVFLCTDFLGCNPDTVHSASALFSRLSDQDHLSEGRSHLLVELFGIIQRPRLLRDLNLTRTVSSNLISSYRRLLYCLSEQLTTDNLKDVKFLLDDKLPRKKLEGSTTLEIFIEMEHRDLISNTDLKLLEDIFEQVCPKLLEKIHQFKAQNCVNLRVSSQETAGEPTILHPTQDSTCNPHDTLEEAEIIRPMAELLSFNTRQGPTSLCNDQDGHEVGPPEPRGLHAGTDSHPVRSHTLVHSPQETQTSSGAETSMTGASAPDLETYPMTAGTRGCCMIINNDNFSSSSLQNREGTMVDEESLKKVFTWLGFEVEIHQDCTSKKILVLMQDLANRAQREWDCVACCILSHGQEGCVYGVDGITVNIKKLMEPFIGSKCPTLAEKPKLFFIQACQGTNIQAIVYTDGEESEHGGVDTDAVQANDCIPGHADFLMAMATVPSFVSYREKTNGTWYIQSLCQNLVHMVPRGCDLVSILTKVNADVSKKTDRTRRKKQMPQPAFTLTKKLVFPPPSSPEPALQKPTSFWEKKRVYT